MRWEMQSWTRGGKLDGGRSEEDFEEKGVAGTAEMEDRAAEVVTIYPDPLFSHKEVCEERFTFIRALTHFHSNMDSRVWNPVIGGKILDLYSLYDKVTVRGGIEKVILDGRLREVIEELGLPPATSNNLSYRVRTHYMKFLYHFEQVYFFCIKGPVVNPPDILKSKCHPSKVLCKDPAMLFIRRNSLTANDEHQDRPYGSKEKGLASGPSDQAPLGFQSDTIMALPAATSGSLTFPPASATPVTGTIDGEVENGYMVTLWTSSQMIRGVLYPAPQENNYQVNEESTSTLSTPRLSPPTITLIDFMGPASSGNLLRKRQKLNYRDVRLPKPIRSAYNIFFEEMHYNLEVLYPNSEKELCKHIVECWKKLTEEVRNVYHELGRRDEERYRKELTEYWETMNLPAPSRCSEPAKSLNP